MTRKTHIPTFGGGVGDNARREWSDGNIVPSQQQQLLGFFVGQIMDDYDPMYMGRVWVYIPEISATRWDEGSTPSGGTTLDRQDITNLTLDEKHRLGWLLVSPMTPFAGSDDYRNESRPDGTSSRRGDVNSYGMTAQARNGDSVGLMFGNSDPNSGYYIGMIPKSGRNGMVPGTPGTAASKTRNKTTGSNQAGITTKDPRERGNYTDAIMKQVQDEAPIPTYDKVPTDDDPRGEDKFSTSDQTANMARAGVISDMHRGAGTSGARRESPSYVAGIKTSGWGYDSEKYNRDVDGKQFQDRVDELSSVNTTGHQLVMDDHPDHQLVRMRTSAGAQILMNDSCADPYIYMQTATGEVWIELADSGAINIFAAGDINTHAEGDYNLTVDGDYNVSVAGDYDMRVAGDSSHLVSGFFQQEIQSDVIISIDGEYDFQTGNNSRVTYNGDYDMRVAGNNTQTTSGGSEIVSSGSIRIQTEGDLEAEILGDTIWAGGNAVSISSGAAMNVKTGGVINIQTDDAINIKAGVSIGVEAATTFDLTAGETIKVGATGAIGIQTAAAMSVKSGGAFGIDSASSLSMLSASGATIDGSTVRLNQGLSGAIADVNPTAVTEVIPALITGEFFFADSAAEPVLPALKLTPMAPTSDEIISNTSVQQEESVASVVPQHQPWGPRCGVGETTGTNQLITTTPINGGFVPMSNNITCTRANTDPLSLIRTGSGFANALTPDSLFGGFAQVLGQLSVFGGGQNYTGLNLGEAPSHSSLRIGSQGETHTPDGLTPSTQIVKYIKQQSTFIRTPRLNALKTGYVVGYGTPVTVGTTIGGKTVTSSDLSNITSFGTDLEKGFATTKEEATTALQAEIDTIDTWAETTFPDIEFTQQQYDGMISFVHNIGLSKIQSTPSGQTFISSIQSGDMGAAQTEMYKHVYTGGTMNCSLLDRRRYEVGRFGQLPNRGGITKGNNEYTHTGTTTKIANFTISEEVRNAIVNAQKNVSPQIPDGYLFTIAAQESGFNPNAKASTSSAAGLFQFIKSTGKLYGLDVSREPTSNVFDPQMNANAAAAFTVDNYNRLVAVGVTTPTATDLYVAHFLGSGDGRLVNGATRFLTLLSTTPTATPATDGAFGKAAAANKYIFYNKNGTARTYTEVYQLMFNKIERKRKYFTGLDTGTIPPATGTDSTGLITWVPGLRSPDFSGVGTIRTIVETSASEAGLTQLAFNSGHRTFAENKAAGGATNSQHLVGKALDIHIGDMTTAQKRSFIDRLAINGVTGMGVGTNTIHVDNRSAARVTWQYSGGNGYARDILRTYKYINA
jgi:GH24 family phage-related lysozyme (muramidase)